MAPTASSGEMPRCWKEKSWSSPILDVVASCSTTLEGSRTWMYGYVLACAWSPMSMESHWEWSREPREERPIHQSPVALGGAPGRDTLRDDAAARVFSDVDHLGARVGLLQVVGDGNRVELPNGPVALEDHGGVLPSDGGACLDLRPGDLGIRTLAEPSLRDEVVDAPLTVLVPSVPVLARRVLDLRVRVGGELHHCGVQLVRVVRRGSAALQVGHVAALLSHDQRTLELARLHGIDAEVGREFHWARHALGDVGEGPVAEHRRVQGGEVVVPNRHDATHVLAYEVGVILDGLGDTAEDDAGLRQVLPEGRRDGDRVEDGVHRHVSQPLLLGDGDAQLLEGPEQFRVYLVEALLLGLLLRLGVVHDVLVVDGRVHVVAPLRLLHGQPLAVGLQAEVQHPLGLLLLCADNADRLLAQAPRNSLAFDVPM